MTKIKQDAIARATDELLEQVHIAIMRACRREHVGWERAARIADLTARSLSGYDERELEQWHQRRLNVALEELDAVATPN